MLTPKMHNLGVVTLAMISALCVMACRPDDGQQNPDDGAASDLGGKTADMSSTTPGPDADMGGKETETITLKIATFNASLYRDSEGKLLEDLQGGSDRQAERVAEVLQIVQPDIVLINEFDYVAGEEAAAVFAEKYLLQSQNGATPHDGMMYYFAPESNTGEPSGFDLDNNGAVVQDPGSIEYGNDAYGFGRFPGQYGMAVFSKYPIMADDHRAFRTLLWSSMPGNLQPVDWYGEASANAMRLSSKTHADVPVQVGDRVVHLLISHPTPPSFDGDEDRNGRRNHDEIRFWTDYLSVGVGDGYIVDDAGGEGGLEEDALFVILGDLNSDPEDGGSRSEGIRALLEHPRVQDTKPASAGGSEAAVSDGGANAAHSGDASLDTADFSDRSVGNLRVDYALPSKTLRVVNSGVFWPAEGEPHASLAGVSDHHLVWVEVEVEVEAGATP